MKVMDSRSWQGASHSKGFLPLQGLQRSHGHESITSILFRYFRVTALAETVFRQGKFTPFDRKN
ncbi:MAG: hypothetical protein HY201_04620 [Nitrospirae bacterium]|nr:hypothetical protein [Candidatus Troglogloeales bacterium]